MQIDEARVSRVNDAEPRRGDHVLYWMTGAVRAVDNDALEYAIATANEHGVQLAVVFVLDPAYPEAQQRHFAFLVEGLRAVESGLARRNVALTVRIGDPVEEVADLASSAVELVTDRRYLRHQRESLSRIADRVEVPVTEIETAVVVPVEVTSDKREYAARTIRPKIHRHLDDFLVETVPVTLDTHSDDLPIDGASWDEIDDTVAGIDPGEEVRVDVRRFSGGEHQARATLDRFVEDRLRSYDDNRNQPQTEDVSYMSMYLHFGHISPVAVARAVRGSGAPSDVVDSYIEELVVRRELGFNYVWFEPDYDSYSALPDWARETLEEHRDDPREHVYTRTELERAETHDPYWNAAMTEMRETGYLHNYMRMYWGKKILEWSNTPEYAYRTVQTLNNRHLFDGRDPNSYGNIAWVFGLWDRAWQEREIYGKVRTMTAGGLERKADPEGYVARIEELTGLVIDR